MPDIVSTLPRGNVLLEPFIGSGSVFLNTTYKKYVLCDINKDLINLYETIKTAGTDFIFEAKRYFVAKNNNASAYYRLRARFNSNLEPFEKSLLFLYLNRHCYNGLCRYNQKGEFNVPFGEYRKPHFPELQLHEFFLRSQLATFHCEPFSQAFTRARKGTVIYCDPPYIPLSSTANFTTFASGGFSMDDQRMLADLAKKYSAKGIPTLISNHDVKDARDIYAGARISSINVRRRISANSAQRKSVHEILALYT